MFAAVLAAAAMSPALPPPDSVWLKRMLDDQQRAWNAGKLDDFLTPYLDGPELRFYSGGTVTEGKAAVAARYRKNYQADGKEMGELTFDAIEIQEFGGWASTAMVRGKWAVTTKAGTTAGLFTLVCKKTQDGWRIVHDHTSKADPEPKPPTP